MIKIEKPTSLNPTDILSEHTLVPERTLFLDIETTGLSPARNRVCLIGCAFLDEASGAWQIRQWFDDTGSSEQHLLSSFTGFLQSFDTVIHFNGRTFDLPFLEKRAGADDVPLSFSPLRSIDLYRILTSQKRVLGLPNYRQQTVEAEMGTGRSEHTSGKDFVDGYRLFLKTHSKAALTQILGHNYADMEGLLSLAPILAFQNLTLEKLSVRRAVADTQPDAGGNRQDVLLLTCRLSHPLPLPVRAHKDHCLMKAEKDRCFIRIPLITEEMRLFFKNYRDYYYLPQEDRAIHRSIALFVDRSHRTPAKAETCYERVTGTFLPCWDGPSRPDRPVFRRAYREKETYLLLDNEMKCSPEAMNQYARHVFLHLVSAQ